MSKNLFVTTTQNFHKKHPLHILKSLHTIFRSEIVCLNFTFLGDDECRHSMDSVGSLKTHNQNQGEGKSTLAKRLVFRTSVNIGT